MHRITVKHSLATLVVAAVGGLAAAGPASAGPDEPGLIVYNGHAGLGASAYQHDQTDHEFLATASWRPRATSAWLGSDDRLGAAVTDGTSNTILT